MIDGMPEMPLSPPDTPVVLPVEGCAECAKPRYGGEACDRCYEEEMARLQDERDNRDDEDNWGDDA
jgi:hypothetical protein